MLLKIMAVLAANVLIAWVVLRSWAPSTTFGLPRWPPPMDRPLVCETCGRSFQYMNREALPAGLETLGADGLLVMHIRAQHHEAPGPLHGKLPRRHVTPRRHLRAV